MPTSGTRAATAPTLAPGTSGEKLRAVRLLRNLTVREVASATRRIAERQDHEEFSISAGRLSEIENKGAVPNIYRLYSLAVVYQVDLREMLSWFGVPRD